jgi:hypothetical protein
MKQRRPMLSKLATVAAPTPPAVMLASDHPDWVTLKTACKLVGGEKPISLRSYQRAAASGHLPKPRKMTGAGIARVHRPTLLRVLGMPESAVMTIEHDDAKPIIPGDYGSLKPGDVAGLHRGDAHVKRSHIPCALVRPDGALSKFRSR